MDVLTDLIIDTDTFTKLLCSFSIRMEKYVVPLTVVMAGLLLAYFKNQ